MAGGECANQCDEGADDCGVPNGTACTDDGNACTFDECSGGVCTHPDNDGAVCDDGVFCNGTDTCSAGSCTVHDGDPCVGPDGDSDCAESCDEGDDSCTLPDPAGSACGWTVP